MVGSVVNTSKEGLALITGTNVGRLFLVGLKLGTIVGMYELGFLVGLYDRVGLKDNDGRTVGLMVGFALGKLGVSVFTIEGSVEGATEIAPSDNVGSTDDERNGVKLKLE